MYSSFVYIQLPHGLFCIVLDIHLLQISFTAKSTDNRLDTHKLNDWKSLSTPDIPDDREVWPPVSLCATLQLCLWLIAKCYWQPLPSLDTNFLCSHYKFTDSFYACVTDLRYMAKTLYLQMNIWTYVAMCVT